MYRNQRERHEGADGRWAEVTGASEFWLLTWSGGETLPYRSAKSARADALDWTESGLCPRCARTMPQIDVRATAVPRGAFV